MVLNSLQIINYHLVQRKANLHRGVYKKEISALQCKNKLKWDKQGQHLKVELILLR